MIKKCFKPLSCAVALLLVISAAMPAFAQPASRTRLTARAAKRNLQSVCPRVVNLSGLLLKTTAGGHIGTGDPRNNGFSLICASQCVQWPAAVYHCDGSQAFRMGYYGRWNGNGKPRGYCAAGGQPACPTWTVRAQNRRLNCKGAAYLAQGGGRCMRFNINSNRNGGV